MDFSSITAGLEVASIVTGAIAACALIATAGFAIWGGRKLANMFGGK